MKNNEPKILIIGYFGYKTNQLDGQTVKTRSNYDLLKQEYRVSYFDTEILKVSKFKLINLFLTTLRFNTIIFAGAQNNLKYFYPVLYFLSVMGNKKLIYLAIGGWLNEFLEQNNLFYEKSLKRINSILVETNFLKTQLEKRGFKNVSIIPNFRILPLDYNIKVKPCDRANLRLVFMARIVAEKGIFLIIDFYKKYLENKEDFDKKLTIDFYGKIQDKDEELFLNQIDELPGINYNGVLQPSEIYRVLNNYDVLLLPTYYKGEGFPGTILDAYLSGIPVIATRWKQIPEFVDNGESGLLIEFDLEELFSSIKKVSNDSRFLNRMKFNAFEKGKNYSMEKGLKVLKKCIEL